jgi:Spy/CpxP family protein refolding chaperone
MRKQTSGLAILFLAIASPAWSQAQPYAGLQSRPVKALSDHQIADLRAGRGTGLALAAELNGYPGPMHVLQLASGLTLTDAQHARVAALYDSMKQEAVAIGERLIAAETSLDRLFADKTVTSASLEAVTHEIASLQGALRLAHLKYHLATIEILTPDQVKRYSELRGYRSGAHSPGHHR